MEVVSKKQFRIQWRPWESFNCICSVYVTNQGNPFSVLAPPTNTHTAHSLADCHLGAWITSLGDYLAQIKKLTVLSLVMVLFCKQNLRKLDSFFRSSGLPWRLALRVALGITALNSSHLLVHWVGANTGGTYSHTPLISTTVSLRRKFPSRWGTVTGKKWQIK